MLAIPPTCKIFIRLTHAGHWTQDKVWRNKIASQNFILLCKTKHEVNRNTHTYNLNRKEESLKVNKTWFLQLRIAKVLKEYTTNRDSYMQNNSNQMSLQQWHHICYKYGTRSQPPALQISSWDSHHWRCRWKVRSF